MPAVPTAQKRNRLRFFAKRPLAAMSERLPAIRARMQLPQAAQIQMPEAPALRPRAAKI